MQAFYMLHSLLRMLPKFIVVAVGVFVANVVLANYLFAQSHRGSLLNEAFSKDGAFAVVDSVVTLDIVPVRALLLQTPQIGVVQQYDGEFSYFSNPEAKETAQHQILTSARVLWNFGVDYKTSQRVVFLFYDSKGHFAATPVRNWSYEDAKQHTLTNREIESKIVNLHKDIEIAKSELASLETKLAELREQAATIAGVDKIVDLRVELAKLTAPEEEKEAEFDRLSSLVDAGYALKDPANTDELRAELNSQLVDMAKATVSADRLSRSKGQSAVERVRQKLRLIRDTKDIDADELARQVLDMRNRRREYESRMGLNRGKSELDY